jgi:hypothetical protein
MTTVPEPATRLTCENTYPLVLGVKGSQVQILSSRRHTRGPLNWTTTSSAGLVCPVAGRDMTVGHAPAALPDIGAHGIQ